MNPLQAPSRAFRRMNELPRQPIEQFRMRRLAPLKAEVARRADQAAAKVVAPEAVVDDSRGKRGAGAGNPFRQGLTAGGVWGGFCKIPTGWKGRLEPHAAAGSHLPPPAQITNR